jgi:CRP/FNR family transcriptional regulator
MSWSAGYHGLVTTVHLGEALRGSSLFRRLSDADRARLSAVAHLKAFTRGDVVFREAEPADAFYTVVSGRVKIFKVLPSGKEVILEIFGAGDPLGAIAAYEGRPFPASALALEETTCLILPRAPFFALLEQHPTLVRGLLSGMTQRLIELTSRLAEMSAGRIESRLARLFLKLADNK